MSIFLMNINHAATFYFAVDVPADLGGMVYEPSQVVLCADNVYSLEQSFPISSEISALDVTGGTTWVFAPASPVNIGGTYYDTNDLIAVTGGIYSTYFDGATAGVPEYASIDAVFHDGGIPVLSFDVPVNLGGTEYSQNDLVQYNAGFSIYWDAEVEGVSGFANLIGANINSSGRLTLSFDIPVNIDGTLFLPGELIEVRHSSYSLYSSDVNWPEHVVLGDFAFDAPVTTAAGYVPDGNLIAGTPLTVSKGAGSDLYLVWGDSCIIGDSDYAIYEGTVGSYYSHIPLICSSGGGTSTSVTPSEGSKYYIIVPVGSGREGSYGFDSTATERETGSVSCYAQEVTACP